MSETDMDLLAHYAHQRVEDAFAEIVRRHLNLVYSTALRTVRSPQLAEEVSQTIFVKLARNADRLPPDTILTAWLYRVTIHEAIDAVRREARRQSREATATEMNVMNTAEAEWRRVEPLLDDAMQALSDTDRAAVLLRYFENKSFREVGRALGVSEDTAQKRVSRAVERLHSFFVKRGVATGGSGLAALISSNAVQVAPAGLAGSLAGVSLSEVATGTTMTIKLSNMMNMTKLKGCLATLAIVGTGMILFVQHQSQAGLRRDNEVLRQEIALTKTDNNQFVSNRVVSGEVISSLRNEQLWELLRLRGEVGLLRRQQRELEQLVAAAQAKGFIPDSTDAKTSQAYGPGLFQIQQVLEEANEDSEMLTNNVTSTVVELLHVRRTPLLDHTAIRSVDVMIDPISGRPMIDVMLNEEGGELFEHITQENFGKRLAVVIDGHLHSTPVVQMKIGGGKLGVSGSFTLEEAKVLAAKINGAVTGR